MIIMIRKFGFILLLLVSSMLFIGNVHAIWVWQDVKSYTVTQGMFVSSSTYIKNVNYDDPDRVWVDADNPEDIDFGLHIYYHLLLNVEANVEFIYDLGKNALGGVYTNEATKYRAIISWTLNGVYDDNDSPKTYLKFYYEIYYMQGSTKHVLGTTTVTINDKDYGYSNKDITHIVQSSSSVPLYVNLYVYIKVTLSADQTVSEWDLYSRFYDCVLHSVMYQKYHYYPWG